MRTEVVPASTIDEAVEEILDELKRDTASSSRNNVIYFDGWDGLGASAVLRAVGRRLTPEAGRRAPAATGLEFSRIFHIDCSKWESRRAMQRTIVQELKLPDWVMEMLDAQDEEEDFRGVAKGSRTEIPRVTEAIYQHIQVAGAIYGPHDKNRRFLVIFYNGSSEEIDLDNNFSFPLAEYSRNKVLWSFQGRFRAYPRTKVDGALKNTKTTDVFLSAASSDLREHELYDILHHEAGEVACEMFNAGADIDWRATATNCFLYMLKLCRIGNDLATEDYDLATHVCNYWKCDGTIQLHHGDIGTDDAKLWQAYDALQRELRLDVYQNPYFPSPVGRNLLKRMAYWSSPTYGFMLVPDRHITSGMFQQFVQICVLKLSACTFSFTSPPFLCCYNLRFLWLDRCQDKRWAHEVARDEDVARFLQRLWVLDVRYSNGAFLSKAMVNLATQLWELNVMGEDDEWLDTDLLQRRMHKIRKLRVKDSRHHYSSMILQRQILFSRMDNMELIDFSSNHIYSSFSIESSCSSLVTVVISGSTKLQVISLMGCAKLKNIFLSGSFPVLHGIDITGAAVETLDLSSMTAQMLNQLCLLDCEKLHAILWPPVVKNRRKTYLDKLRISTTQKEATAAGRSHSQLDWHISARDARILWSLESVKDYFSTNHAYVEISSPIPLGADVFGSKDDGMKSISRQHVQVELKQIKDRAAIYTEVADTLMCLPKAANEGNWDPPVIMCPLPPDVLSQGCYIHIPDHHIRIRSQIASIDTIPLSNFICNGAKVLDIHDSLIVTLFIASQDWLTTWDQLEWCRVERCPKLIYVFNPGFGEQGFRPYIAGFKKLRTTWASHLPNARYIWAWKFDDGEDIEPLKELTLLHLDFCPRMLCIMYMYYPRMSTKGFDTLENLEIMWCGDLSVAFDFNKAWMPSDREVLIFPKLKHIRLQELPKLINIWKIADEAGMKAHMPELKTIKIRGCWSLRILPIIESNNVVECNCEKEWWDRLQWESVEHASRYKPTHLRYYKKTMLRGSVLR